MTDWESHLKARGLNYAIYGGSPDQRGLPGVVQHPPVAEKRKNKFNAKRVERHGRWFDSIAEADRADQLILLEKARDIRGLGFQPVFALPGGIRYVADFVYYRAGRQVCEDVKGFATAAFRMKRKLFIETYPQIELRIVDADGNLKPLTSRKSRRAA